MAISHILYIKIKYLDFRALAFLTSGYSLTSAEAVGEGIFELEEGEGEGELEWESGGQHGGSTVVVKDIQV